MLLSKDLDMKKYPGWTQNPKELKKKHYDGALDSWYKAGSIEWVSFVLPIIMATHYSSEYIQSPTKGLVSRFHITFIGLTRIIIYFLLVINSPSKTYNDFDH